MLKSLFISLLVLGSFSITLLAGEMGFRAYFDQWAYGIVPSRRDIRLNATQSVRNHTDRRQGYSKYFPHQKRVDYDRKTGHVFKVGINAAGFRGRDVEGKAGIRVVALGASSTFGYGSRDDETYPVYLESYLNEACEQSVEVINLGMPHMTSGQVLSLFQNEGIPLNPDVVTFYGGANDTVGEQTYAPWLERHSVLAKFVVLQVRTPQIVDFEDIRADFIANVSEMAKASVVFVAVSQLVRGSPYYMWLHGSLMGDLKVWAENESVPFVDFIALDRERSTLVSYVHLSPRGNRLIATALTETIQKEVCET